MNYHFMSFCLLFSVSCGAVESQFMIPYEINGKIGFVNNQLRKVTEPIFKLLLNHNNRGFVQVKKEDGANVIIGPDGQELAFNYDSGILNDDYWYTNNFKDHDFVSSTINSFVNGKKIRTPYFIKSGSNSSMKITIPEAKNPAKTSYMNFKGELLFPSKLFTQGSYSFDESGSVAVVTDENFDMRLINYEGEFITPPNWGVFYNYFREGLCFGIHGKETGFYDFSVNLKIAVGSWEPFTYESLNFAPAFYSGVLPVVVKDKKLFLKTSWMKGGNNLPWRLINTKGEFVGSEIASDYVSEFRGGFGQVLRNKKWAYLKPDGTFLTDFVFDSVKEFVQGYGRIEVNKRDGLVDSNGKIYWCDEFK